MPIRVAAIGECMIELSQHDAATFSLAFGGDTLNTAVYLARADRAAKRLSVDYVTALGEDPYSDAMVAQWQQEGVGTATVARLAGKLPGLYTIRVDAAGERRFYYWRSASAARLLFDDERTKPLLARLRDYDLVYLSLITLSILTERARDRLYDALDSIGGKVAIDTNYRPAAWPDRETAQRNARRFLGRADIALPTFDDEQALFADASPDACAGRYDETVPETAIKLGAEGALLVGGGVRLHVPVPASVQPVDTTAAGDAFNAGYLWARLTGGEPAAAALAGHRLAAAVIRHRGALIPREATPALGGDDC